jgi:hypothetical protein
VLINSLCFGKCSVENILLISYNSLALAINRSLKAPIGSRSGKGLLTYHRTIHSPVGSNRKKAQKNDASEQIQNYTRSLCSWICSAYMSPSHWRCEETLHSGGNILNSNYLCPGCRKKGKYICVAVSDTSLLGAVPGRSRGG